jgi:hypothetical protein
VLVVMLGAVMVVMLKVIGGHGLLVMLFLCKKGDAIFM